MSIKGRDLRNTAIGFGVANAQFYDADLSSQK